MGSYVIGPRIGKYDSNGNIHPIPGHSVPIASLGAFILFLVFINAVLIWSPYGVLSREVTATN